MKRAWIYLSAGVALSAAGCGFIESLLGLRSIQEPHVAVHSVAFSGITFDTIDMLFTLRIDNPNPIGISVAAYDYDFLLNDRSYISAEQPSGFDLSAGDTSYIEIPLSIHFADLFRLHEDMRQRDTVAYRFSGSVSFDLPVAGRTVIPLQRSGSLPVLRTPRIKVEDFEIGAISFIKADATISLRIDNPNAFALHAEYFDYRFLINGRPVVTGEQPDDIRIGEKSTGTFILPVTIEFVEFGQSIYRILRGEEQATYRITGSASFQPPVDYRGGVPFTFDHSGTLSVTRP
jgi:LEA14-like dessication related protein